MDERDFRLLERYLDGTIDEQDLPRLEELLRASPEARARLRTLATVDAKLHEMAAAVPDLPLWSSNDAQSQAAGADRRNRSVKLPVLAAAVAIAIAVLITIAWTWLGGGDRQRRLADTEEQAEPGVTPDGQETAADNAVAVLTRVVDAKWEQSGPALDEGSPLEPGPLKLTSGLVQIEFYSGAALILEGPADFELATELRGILREGKLWASVPSPARGFTVDIPGGQVEDHGRRRRTPSREDRRWRVARQRSDQIGGRPCSLLRSGCGVDRDRRPTRCLCQVRSIDQAVR